MAPHAPAPAAFGSESEFEFQQRQQQFPAGGLRALSRPVSAASFERLACASTSEYSP
ncbi:hypothetical protein V6Z96_005374 [Aspergillus fumigatus]